jgi:hypothetical protein
MNAEEIKQVFKFSEYYKKVFEVLKEKYDLDVEDIKDVEVEYGDEEVRLYIKFKNNYELFIEDDAYSLMLHAYLEKNGKTILHITVSPYIPNTDIYSNELFVYVYDYEKN